MFPKFLLIWKLFESAFPAESFENSFFRLWLVDSYKKVPESFPDIKKVNRFIDFSESKVYSIESSNAWESISKHFLTSDSLITLKFFLKAFFILETFEKKVYK